MEASPLELWQQRLDTTFPSGAMAFAQPHEEGDGSVAVIWFRVITMAGLDPVLNLYTRPVVLPGRVLTSWVVTGTEGGITRVSATFAPPYPDYEFVTPPQPLAAELAQLQQELRESWAEA